MSSIRRAIEKPRKALIPLGNCGRQEKRPLAGERPRSREETPKLGVRQSESISHRRNPCIRLFAIVGNAATACRLESTNCC